MRAMASARVDSRAVAGSASNEDDVLMERTL
jgi:hypothetical protein